MPKQFIIEQGGANRSQINAIASEFMGLRVSRDRQAVLVFDPDEGTIATMTRTSSAQDKQDMQSVRRQVKSLLVQAGTVMVGLVEGSDASEHRMTINDKQRTGFPRRTL